MNPTDFTCLGRLLTFSSLVLGAAGIASGRGLFQGQRSMRMAPQPENTFSLKPHTVGRFLIDLPEGAAFGMWYQRYCGSGRISMASGVTPDQFEIITNECADQLRATPHREGGSRLVLDKRLNIPFGRAIVYWDSKFFRGSFLESKDYALIQGCLYRFDCSTQTDPMKQEAHFRFLEEMFRAIRPLQPGEIPTEHGFCFDRSILVDKPRPRIFETVTAMGAWLDHPDVHFSFTTFGNGPRPDPPLLERLKDATRYWGCKVLRSRRRDLPNGEWGEERLERVREANWTKGHLFIWEAPGLPDDDYEHPQLRLEMSTGVGREGPVNSSLSDKEALRLWDAIVDSIRLRPVTSRSDPGRPDPPGPPSSLW